MGKLSTEDAAAIRAWLGRNQFQQVSSIGGDTAPFGDRQEVWQRDGSLIRLTSDRGEWFYDFSRHGAGFWLDIDEVVSAMRWKQHDPIERVELVASAIDDRLLASLDGAMRRSP